MWVEGGKGEGEGHEGVMRNVHALQNPYKC